MIYLGCSQLSYSFWKGELYPDGTRPKDYLKYYSTEFGCLELNSTFYDLPQEKTIKQWTELVKPQFKFCPKFPQQISHERNLLRVEALVNNFIETVNKFDSRLGICFLQLSLTMSVDKMYLIDELLTFIDHRIKVSVEIRPGWLKLQPVLDECLKILKKHKAGIVIVDGAETVNYLNSIKLTNSSAFIRFLSYNHPTDFKRIDDWINLIKFWQDKGIKEVYFILHFADGVNEPPIVKYTKEKFERELGIDRTNFKQGEFGF